VVELKAGLALPDPWNMDLLIERVAETIGKPIRVVPHPDLATDRFPCGLVVERTDDIVIIYDSTSSGYHGDHIVLHEIAHLLLDHAAPDHDRPASIVNAAQTLLGEIDAAKVLRVLGRTDYDEAEESQAELFASLVMSESGYGRTGSSSHAAFFRD
jgi:hypothetical protein